ncbi:hypothetical protein LTS15_011275 [Exophiala xenobiotica]|nr:hypothetical protein LTS15_011275 [Exophiala xenobiotica]
MSWGSSTSVYQFLAFLLGPRTVYECHISAGVESCLESLDTLMESSLASFAPTQVLSLSGIRASNVYKVWVFPYLDRSPNPFEIELQIDHVLPLELAASSGDHLVFNVQPSNTCVLIKLDCALDVQWTAETSVSDVRCMLSPRYPCGSAMASSPDMASA